MNEPIPTENRTEARDSLEVGNPLETYVPALLIAHHRTHLPKVFATVLSLASLGLSLCASGTTMQIANHMVYSGMADASGAVVVSSNLFIAASDEDNILRLYSNEKPGAPIKEFDLNGFLDLQGKSLETDIEAGARIADRAFWIGSHGSNRDGKSRPNRRRFFATKIEVVGGQVNLWPVGQPCETLLDNLVADSRFDRFHLAEAASRAPKTREALAIEGLSATPEGHLLLGFRNPIPERQALLIPLLNPNDVISGKRARFGDAIQLDLAGLGVRDLTYYDGTYVIIAGSYRGGGRFQLYSWRGVGTRPQRIKVQNIGNYTPEAIIIYPEKGLREIQILSDDGARFVDGVPRKALRSPSRLTFRSFWLSEKAGNLHHTP